MTPEQRAAAIDLECSGVDDHDPAPCPKCERIRTKIVEQVREAEDEMVSTLREAARLEMARR